MTTFLFSILTAGAEKMAVSDPHGWTLTLISVCVVFSALLVLYFMYSLSGNIFSGKFNGRKKNGCPDGAAAAAIALALEAEMSDAVEAAVATALHLYLSETVHDIEPGFITIRKKDNNNWKFKRK